MPLTDTECKTLKPSAKPYKKADAQGMYLEIMPNGSKYWRFRYRYLGKETRILVHIPKHYQRDYKRALRCWLPFEWTRQTVTVKPVNHPEYGKLSPLSHIHGVLRYMCKGIDPETPVRGIQPSYQGEIHGRRWGTSKPPTQRLGF